MREISCETVKDAVYRLCSQACIALPEDTMAMLHAAAAGEESDYGKANLEMAIENACIAKKEKMPMKNDSNPIIRSEKVTIDMHICAALSESRSSGEIYFAAIAPDMELTVITLDEAPDILPCFDEDDAYLNIPDSSLLLSYNPAQVLKLAGKRYLTGPVILVRTNMDGEFISLTIDQVYLFQKYLMRHSVTLMADGQKLPCICID